MQTKIYTDARINSYFTFKESDSKEIFALELAQALDIIGQYSFQPTYNLYYSFMTNTTDQSVVFGIEIYHGKDFLRRLELGSDIIGGNASVALDEAVNALLRKHVKMLECSQNAAKVLLKHSVLIY